MRWLWPRCPLPVSGPPHGDGDCLLSAAACSTAERPWRSTKQSQRTIFICFDSNVLSPRMGVIARQTKPNWRGGRLVGAGYPWNGRKTVSRKDAKDAEKRNAVVQRFKELANEPKPWNVGKHLIIKNLGLVIRSRPAANEPNFVAGPPAASGSVQGRGLVRWQWSSIVRRAYSGMPSRRRSSGMPSRRGSGSRARMSSERVISCPRPSPLRPSPAREARSAIASRAPADPLRLHDGQRFTWPCPGWPPRRRRGRLLRGRRGSSA
jgi:hypothetical protein